MPEIFVPRQQLEDLVPGTWYVDVIATYPKHRGRSIGTELMAIAERLALSVVAAIGVVYPLRSQAFR